MGLKGAYQSQLFLPKGPLHLGWGLNKGGYMARNGVGVLVLYWCLVTTRKQEINWIINASLDTHNNSLARVVLCTLPVALIFAKYFKLEL